MDRMFQLISGVWRIDDDVAALRHSSHRFVGMGIYLLVCAAFLQAFPKHVIPPAACAVHADLNAVMGEKSCELVAGELAFWVGVEDLGAAILRDRLPHCVEEEVRGQRIGESPRQHSAARPPFRTAKRDAKPRRMGM